MSECERVDAVLEEVALIVESAECPLLRLRGTDDNKLEQMLTCKGTDHDILEQMTTGKGTDHDRQKFDDE